MEKRLLLAFVLSIGVLLIYQQLNPPPKRPTPDTQNGAQAESGDQAGNQGSTQPGPGASSGPTPSGEPGGNDPQPGTPPAEPEVESVPNVTLENDELRIELTQMGAAIERAWLKAYYPDADERDADGEPLQILMPSDHGLRAMRLDDLDRGRMEVGSKAWKLVAVEEGRSVTYETTYQDGQGDFLTTYTLRKQFTLPEGKARHLEVSFSWGYENDQGKMPTGSFGVLVSGGVFQDVGGDMTNPPKSVLYPIDDEISVHTSSDLDGSERDKLENGTAPRDIGVRGVLAGKRPSTTGGFSGSLVGEHRYVADCSNYFGAFFLLTDFPASVRVRINGVGSAINETVEAWEQGASGLRTASVVEVPRNLRNSGETETWKGLLYLGPVDKKTMSESLDGIIADDKIDALGKTYRDQLGFAGSIASVIILALRGIHGFVGNWGVSIILLTFCVRFLLFPLNRKSQTSMLRMQEAHTRIKPQLDALKEKHKDDPKVLAAEQMKLFKKENVPMVPVGGCLPILLQMPIFFGLFSALRASVDLRQAEWWWVRDLSQPDRLVAFETGFTNPMALCGCFPMASQIDGLNLLPILMTIAWIANSMLMPKPENMNEQMAQQRKMMMFMPLLFGFFMYGYAAGLSLYWLTSSLIGIVESRIIKKLLPIKAK